MATNTNVSVVEMGLNAGGNNSGMKIGTITAGAKAAQNDTWTLIGVKQVYLAIITDDSTGILEEPTWAANVATLTNASTGTATGFVIYRS